MANWITKLRVGDVYHADLPIPELAGVMAKRLKAVDLPVWVPLYLVEQCRDIVEEFESLAGDPTGNVEDFDGVMEQLYDWADTPLDGQWNGRKLCWVDTLARAVPA